MENHLPPAVLWKRCLLAILAAMCVLPSLAWAGLEESRCHQAVEWGQPDYRDSKTPKLPSITDPDKNPKALVTESFPTRIAAGEVFEQWLVLPESKAKPELRTQGSEFAAITPLGTFALYIAAEVAATRAPPAEGRQEPASAPGLLAYLCFDPGWKGARAYPRPPIVQDAERENLLTSRQRKLLARIDTHFESRIALLRAAWKEFRAATDDMRARARFLERLLTLYELPSELTLSPQEFFDRPQRRLLRRMGHAIGGRCQVRMGSEGLTLEARGCPLFQLVSAWNQQFFERGAGGAELDSWLTVEKAQRDDELDLTLRLPAPLDRAILQARSKLLTVKGIRRVPVPYKPGAVFRPDVLPEGLTRSDVDRVTGEKMSALTECTNEHKKRTPALGGVLVMNWLILASGETASISCKSPKLCGSFLDRCLSDRIASWTFPRNAGPSYPASYAIHFNSSPSAH